MLLIDKGWGDCIHRDQIEISTNIFRFFSVSKQEIKTGIGRKLTTVQRYTFRDKSRFFKRQSHHCISDSLIYVHSLVEERIVLELR